MNFKKLNEQKCDFCKKALKKGNLFNVRDKYKTYIICSRCNENVSQYQKEYDKQAKKIEKKYQNSVEQLSMRLRKKYKLKMHK